MKRTHCLIAFVLLALVAVSATPVWAQDGASTDTTETAEVESTPEPTPRSFLDRVLRRDGAKEERVEVRQDAREDRQEQRQEQRQETRDSIQEKRQEVRAHVAQVHAERLGHRFEVYFERLENIIERVQGRIDVLSADGKDTAAAQAKLNEAKASLTQAKTKADAAISAFSGIDADKYEEQRALALQARDIAQEAREDFKSVMDAIRETLTLLKGLV